MFFLDLVFSQKKIMFLLDNFRLKGEKDLCALINKLMDYVNARLDKDIFLEEEICKLYMLRIEHLYYKVNFQYFFHSYWFFSQSL